MPAPATRIELRWDGAGSGASDAGRPDALALEAAREAPALRVSCRGPELGAAAGCAARILERATALESLALRCTGLHSAGASGPGPAVAELAARCGRRRLRFAVELPLDAQADAFALLAGRPTSLAPILEASRALRRSGAAVEWWVPVVRPLVHRLEGLFSLAREEALEPVLVPPWTIDPEAAQAGLLETEEARFVRDFLCYRLLDEERARLTPERARLYASLLRALGAKGLRPPAGSERVAVIERDARGGWALRREERPAFGRAPEPAADGAFDPFEPSPSSLASRAAEAARVLGEGVRALGVWALGAAAPGAPQRARAAASYPRALLIGAYGGEHIGDAAILGGVLRRLAERFGTRSAVLLSQRPAHSRHLVAGLHTDVALRVAAHAPAVFREELARSDAVVFAGGPLMDLPKQLVLHLYGVACARRAGKPFLVEGIGAGPFKRWPSEWVGRRLVRNAQRVSVRTAADARTPLVRDLEPEVGRDPAFDYLETRGPELALSEAERDALEDLLADGEARVTVGINLRPIRELFTEGAGGAERAGYTRRVEARFEERLAEGLRRFARASPRPPRLVFFPMNAIQFGLSDLRSAYRLARRLGREVELRVWQGDPGLDAVLALLRRLDAVVAMRFHANIFALSQGRPVIGIDYRPGAPDKVHALLRDRGREADCARIDEMTAEWLCERLRALTARAEGATP